MSAARSDVRFRADGDDSVVGVRQPPEPDAGIDGVDTVNGNYPRELLDRLRRQPARPIDDGAVKRQFEPMLDTVERRAIA
jgi:hypothetical protein